MSQTERNKENAIAFYKMAYEGQPKSAVEKFIGDEYIQHNPDVADGLDGFINYLIGWPLNILRSP